MTESMVRWKSKLTGDGRARERERERGSEGSWPRNNCCISLSRFPLPVGPYGVSRITMMRFFAALPLQSTPVIQSMFCHNSSSHPHDPLFFFWKTWSALEVWCRCLLIVWAVELNHTVTGHGNYQVPRTTWYTLYIKENKIKWKHSLPRFQGKPKAVRSEHRSLQNLFLKK